MSIRDGLLLLNHLDVFIKFSKLKTFIKELILILHIDGIIVSLQTAFNLIIVSYQACCPHLVASTLVENEINVVPKLHDLDVMMSPLGA